MNFSLTTGKVNDRCPVQNLCKNLIGKVFADKGYLSKVKYLTQEICKDNGVEILRGKVASNHVHIYVSVPPYQSISKVMQYLKGKISRKIQQEFPELRKKYWGKHLWSVGYFVRTAGNVTDQMIKDYVDRHESIEDKLGDFQVEN